MSAAQRTPRIVGLGIACLDYLFIADPVAGGGHGRLVDYGVEGGGLVATALVAAARLGAAAEIWTWVGDDREGELVLAGLRGEGVDVSRAQVVPGARTAVSFVQVSPDGGERTIYHRRGADASAADTEAVAGRELQCDIALVDGAWPEASLAFARRARGEGIPVVGDFCPTGECEQLAGVVSVLVVSSACADLLAPGRCRREQRALLAALGPGFAGITDGAEGCWYAAGDAVGHQPAFAVDVVDTTGAGDVFHGALAFALGVQWSPDQAVEFASAVAGLSCRALGGRRSIPGQEEALEFLREHGSERWAR